MIQCFKIMFRLDFQFSLSKPSQINSLLDFTYKESLTSTFQANTVFTLGRQSDACNSTLEFPRAFLKVFLVKRY